MTVIPNKSRVAYIRCTFLRVRNVNELRRRASVCSMYHDFRLLTRENDKIHWLSDISGFYNTFHAKAKGNRNSLTACKYAFLGHIFNGKTTATAAEENNLRLFRKTSAFNGLFDDSFHFPGAFLNENDRRADRWPPLSVRRHITS